MRKLSLLILINVLIWPTAWAQLNMTFRSQLTYPGQELANIWGYANGANEYALVGHTSGVSIVSVTDPDNPSQLFQVNGTWSYWREIRTWNQYAYVVTEGGNLGLQIIDMSALPGSITTKYWKGSGAINNLLNKAHSLQITDGYLYLHGTNLFGGRTLIINLADPWNPVYMGVIPGTYVHDGYVRNDTLWACNIYNGYVSAISVANKSAPTLINTQNTPNNFPHNTWLNSSGSVLFTTDEVSNSFLSTYDVSNPANITLLDKVQLLPGSGSIVHNTHVINDYAVTSWYRSGVAIVDALRPDNLVVVGHYDTSPYSGNGFNGCWGVYPYLPSGNIIAADIEQGLIVLTPTYTRGCYLEGVVTDSLTGIPLSNVLVQIVATATSENTKITGQYKMGLANAGTYTVTFTRAGYTSKTISGVSLLNGKLTNVNVQLVPIGAPLPVTWAYFNGGHENSCNLIKWGTLAEHNAYGFYLERSEDATDFMEIAFVDANNKNTLTHYNQQDCEHASKAWYYRLRQVDFDGSVAYSKIIYVDVEKTKQVTFFPNPFSDRISVSAPHQLDAVALKDIHGRLIETVISSDGKTVSIPEHIPKGIYFLEAIIDDQLHQYKLIKN